MSTQQASQSAPSSQSSPTRVRADRARAQAVALAELAKEQAAQRAKSDRLRQMRLDNQNKKPDVAKFMAARRKKLAK